jgi:hypothetical protein
LISVKYDQGNMNLIRTGTASVLLVVLGSSGRAAHAQSLSASLTELTSKTYDTRKKGFYAIFRLANASTPPNAGFHLQAERTAAYAHENPAVATALIALLEREVQPDPAKGMLSEDSYFGDLIGCVADLEDSRAVNGLLGAISSGGMAEGGLLALGPVAVPGLLQTLHQDRHEFARAAAASILGRLVERGGVGNDTASIKTGLIAGLGDPSMYVRRDAADALRSFRGAELRGVMQSLASKDSAVTMRAGKRVYPVRAAAIEWLRKDSLKKPPPPPGTPNFREDRS